MVGIVMIVKDEGQVVRRCLESVLSLIDFWVIVDTGSQDDTQSVIRDTLRHVPGKLHERPWVNFGHNFNEALSLARGSADWLLRMDADMTAEINPNLRSWLQGNPCPEVDAWNVELEDRGTRWRMPWLIRGNLIWRYEGAVHEWLELDGRQARALTGLTITHHGDGASHKDVAGKFERYLELLKEGYARKDPRSVFYTAETLRALGRYEEAVGVYRERSEMGGFEEEAWFAEYMAATLSKDIPGLLKAYCRRPHRHEPLTAARNLIGDHDDVLFREPK